MKAILAILVLGGLAVGWILNLVELFSLTLASPLGWIIGRVIGVFIPFIGGILGYL